MVYLEGIHCPVFPPTACPAAQVYCSTAATMLWDFPTVRSMNCASVSLGARIARWCPRTVAKLVAVELARLTSFVVIICDYKILQTIAGYAGWSCKPSYNWGCKWCNWLLFFYHEAWGLEHGGLIFEPCVRAIDDTIWAHDIFHVHEVIIHVPYWLVFATWFSSLLPHRCDDPPCDFHIFQWKLNHLAQMGTGLPTAILSLKLEQAIKNALSMSINIILINI